MSDKMLAWTLWTLTVAGIAAAQSPVERGKYLAEQAIVCQECHTPKLESGEYDKSKWMKGATLPFAPIGTIRDWHKSAPDLTPAGSLWKRWGPEGIIKFLETGKNPRGNPAGPPMPGYRLSHEYAAAIVEYLKTLP